MRGFQRVCIGAVLGLAVSTASAEIYADGVVAAFKGKIIVAKDEVKAEKTDKETIAKLKSASLTTVAGSKDAGYWHFYFAGFLLKPGAKAIKMQLFTTDKAHKLIVTKPFGEMGEQAKQVVGDMDLYTEDDGVESGKAYEIRLVSNDKDVVAKSTVTFK